MHQFFTVLLHDVHLTMRYYRQGREAHTRRKEPLMKICDMIDYSGRPSSLIELYRFPAVTLEEICEIRDVIPDQMTEVEEGDDLILYIVDNRVEGVKGLITIWPGKEMACIDMGAGPLWGDWRSDEQLVLTEEFDEVKDADGMPVMGRVAYNTHGLRGIYSQGIFYTLFSEEVEEEQNG